MVSRALLIAVLAALLAGCAGSVSRAPAPPPDEPQVGPQVGPKVDSQPAVRDVAYSAITPLLADARKAHEDGDYERAGALLQRAQRIEPRAPEVYLQLAELRLEQGYTDEARAMAERGLLYCNRATCDRLRHLARD